MSASFPSPSRSRNAFRGAWLAFAILVAGSAPIRAIPPEDGRSLVDDSIRGHDLIEAAVRRIGGAGKLKGIARLHYSLDGETFNGLQGFDPANLLSGVRSGSLLVTVDRTMPATGTGGAFFRSCPAESDSTP